MPYVRVHSESPEKIKDAVEALRGTGVEILTSEDTPQEELILFYLARMNSKLDNLGQLRHLTKIEKHALASARHLASLAQSERTRTLSDALDHSALFTKEENERIVKAYRSSILFNTL